MWLLENLASAVWPTLVVHVPPLWSTLRWRLSCTLCFTLQWKDTAPNCRHSSLHCTLLFCTSLMLRFLQIKGKTFHQQRDYDSLLLWCPLYFSGPEPNPQHLRGMPEFTLMIRCDLPSLRDELRFIYTWGNQAIKQLRPKVKHWPWRSLRIALRTRQLTLCS